jgi:triacylglycerol lipase
MKRAWLPVVLALVLVSGTGPATATESFNPANAEVRPSKRWAKLELLEDSHKAMRQERFTKWVEHVDPEIIEAFHSARPSSSLVLLHYAKGWERTTVAPPVILIHGAGLTSNDCYADRPIMQAHEGLAARLSRAKRSVFAVTFAHGHGDNLLQAEALANAIARVKLVTHHKRVDLVAHSKGGMAARIYLSDAGARWATRYRKDVRRYVMLGTPNGGIDVGFAYPNLNYWILEHKSSAPITFTQALYYGKNKEFADRTVYGPDSPCPGQAQMITRWDARYGKTKAKGQFDVETTYEGGKGKVSTSLGIEKAIADGGRLMERLGKKGIHPSVELAVLAGTSNWLMGMVGERRGPSDGLLLVASALHTKPLLKRGAKLLCRDLRQFNHLQLVYEPRANDWVEKVLSQ